MKPDKIGVLMVLTCLFGMSYIAMSALLYQEFTSAEITGIIMCGVSTILGSVHSVVSKWAQKRLRNVHNAFIHSTETTVFIMGYASVVMVVISLVFEWGSYAELASMLFDVKNNVLWTLIAGCVMTAFDKTTSIFLSMRNTVLDWQVIADTKNVPKIFLDVLINHKYQFDFFSITGGLVIIVAQIIWAVLSPNKKKSGEGLKVKRDLALEQGEALNKQEAEPLVAEGRTVKV